MKNGQYAMGDAKIKMSFSPDPIQCWHTSSSAPWPFLPPPAHNLCKFFTIFNENYDHVSKIYAKVFLVECKFFLNKIFIATSALAGDVAPDPHTMLHAPPMLTASLAGPMSAREGVSLRENEEFALQHCMGVRGIASSGRWTF